MNKKVNYDKERYLKDLASTPLISIALGESVIDPSLYIIEEVKINWK
jgi:hypothetical protein